MSPEPYEPVKNLYEVKGSYSSSFGSVVLVGLEGFLDNKNHGKLEALLDTLTKDNHHIVLNMNNVYHIDSTMCGVLLAGYSAAHKPEKEFDKEFLIVGISNGPKDVLDLLGVTSTIPTYETLDDALKETDETRKAVIEAVKGEYS